MGVAVPPGNRGWEHVGQYVVGDDKIPGSTLTPVLDSRPNRAAFLCEFAFRHLYLSVTNHSDESLDRRFEKLRFPADFPIKLSAP